MEAKLYRPALGAGPVVHGLPHAITFEYLDMPKTDRGSLNLFHDPQHTSGLAGLIPTVSDPTTSHGRIESDQNNAQSERVRPRTNLFNYQLVYICDQYWIFTPVWKSPKILFL